MWLLIGGYFVFQIAWAIRLIARFVRKG